MEENSPSLRLEAFEGPLDLLLHLIEKNKIDIYDIPILEITRQYLDYLAAWNELNMDIASEFIVMAATLISIKARKLLPYALKEGDDEDDDEALLLARLIEYRRYKRAAEKLKEYLPGENGLMLWRTPETIQGERPAPKPEDLLKKVDLTELNALYRKLLLSKKEAIDVNRAGYKSVKKEQFTVTEKITSLRKSLLLMEKISFLQLKKESRTKEEIVTYFLAVLELTRHEHVHIEQNELFGDITIQNKEAEESYVSGNDRA